MAKHILRPWHESRVGRLYGFIVGPVEITGGKIWESGRKEVYFRRGKPVWRRLRLPWRIRAKFMGTRPYGIHLSVWRRTAPRYHRMIWHAAIWTRLLHPCPMVGDRIINTFAGRTNG